MQYNNLNTHAGELPKPGLCSPYFCHFPACTHTCARTHTRTHACTHAHTHVHTHTSMHPCTHINIKSLHVSLFFSPESTQWQDTTMAIDTKLHGGYGKVLRRKTRYMYVTENHKVVRATVMATNISPRKESQVKSVRDRLSRLQSKYIHLSPDDLISVAKSITHP